MSASLMHGTSNVRVPSLFSWSTARPSPTCLWWMTPGLPEPSASATKAEFSDGTSCRARTTAYPMMCVKLTLAPVVRASWLFKMSRLTSSRRAGTLRTLVAVGTDRLASMLATIRDAAPRSSTGSSLPAEMVEAGAGAAGVDVVAVVAEGAAAGIGAAA